MPRTTCTAASVKSLRAARERRICADLSFLTRACMQLDVRLHIWCQSEVVCPAVVCCLKAGQASWAWMS